MAAKKRAATSRGADGDRGPGRELHQTASRAHPTLTTAQGIPISDNQSSLKAGPRGRTLLEDFVLREKITHFDHERIPERIVHARGAAAHGTFECTDSLARHTRAAFLGEVGKKTPAFVRFSTVAGSLGSKDTARDVRGFAVKLYTEQGNFDLVGNNIPIFFVQDAMKFPDLVHSVKQEPDRGFPQAASAHDTFWDFVSLTTESTAMLLWLMSDRAIPRSFRMMEGFGVHTFRLVDERGRSTFVKFHWRPRLGMQSLVWDEAVKLGGADPDFHRRDLWTAIDSGDFPQFTLAVQLFDEKKAASFDFDILDPTKLVPEELVPLREVGVLTLDRNVDNFFAETEQVAFCPANIVPGIDFTDDPLLQGRLFSYLDTQLSRLGGPNFHEIPINRPRCPVHNFQRDGHMRQGVPKGRVAYEPSTLDGGSAREDPRAGFRTFEGSHGSAELVRARPESFGDHFTQARLFWLSQTPVERDHIVSAFVFELGKVDTVAIRERMVRNLAEVDGELASRVAKGLRLARSPAPSAGAAAKLRPSKALSILAKAEPTLRGREVGCLVTDGCDGALVASLEKALAAEGAKLTLVAPERGGVTTSAGKELEVDHQLEGGPSILFDAVAIVVSREGGELLATRAAAIDWARDAYGHMKVVGHTAPAAPLLEAAGIEKDEGVVALGARDVTAFVDTAKQGRTWPREKQLRPAP